MASRNGGTSEESRDMDGHHETKGGDDEEEDGSRVISNHISTQSWILDKVALLTHTLLSTLPLLQKVLYSSMIVYVFDCVIVSPYVCMCGCDRSGGM